MRRTKASGGDVGVGRKQISSVEKVRVEVGLSGVGFVEIEMLRIAIGTSVCCCGDGDGEMEEEGVT
jgi:hypothetical protein